MKERKKERKKEGGGRKKEEKKEKSTAPNQFNCARSRLFSTLDRLDTPVVSSPHQV